MKSALSSLCLALLLVFSFTAHAEEVAPPADAAAAPAEPEVSVEDVLKNVTIHPRPLDFSSAQRLALQNRDERMTLLKEVIACIQRAQSVDEMATCQKAERKGLDLVWLSYCDTDTSFMTARQRRAASRAAKGMEQVPQRTTECERALSAVTGQPLQRGRRQQDAAQ